MIETETKLKAWGNSIGVILPKDALKREHFDVNDEVEVIVRKKSNPLRGTFGIAKNWKKKTRKSTDELLKEVDEDLHGKLRW